MHTFFAGMVVALAIPYLMGTTYPAAGGLVLPATLTGLTDVPQLTITDDAVGTTSLGLVLENSSNVDQFRISDLGRTFADDGGSGSASYARLDSSGNPDVDVGMWFPAANFVSLGGLNQEQIRFQSGLVTISPNSNDIDFLLNDDNGRDSIHIYSDTTPAIIFGSSTELGAYVTIDNDTDANATDEVVFLIQGNDSQTANIMQVEASDDTINFVIDDTGAVSTPMDTIDVDGATTLAITSNVLNLTCTDAETITTITGASSGQLLVILHQDTDCTLNDTDDDTANQLDLVGANGDLVGAADLSILIYFNGTSWQELIRSQN
jgi:hypothetical protein